MQSTTQALQTINNYILKSQPSAPPLTESGWSASDYIALAACIISALTIIASYNAIYLQNKKQINFAAFEKIAVQNIDNILIPLEKLFDDRPNEQLSSHINFVTEILGDIEIFLIEFNDIYTKLEIIKIIKIKDDFSNPIYALQANELRYFRAEYYAFKSRLLYELYLFARNNDN